MKQYGRGEPCGISWRCLEGWEDGHYMILHKIAKQTDKIGVHLVEIDIIRLSEDGNSVPFLSRMPKLELG